MRAEEKRSHKNGVVEQDDDGKKKKWFRREEVIVRRWKIGEDGEARWQKWGSGIG